LKLTHYSALLLLLLTSLLPALPAQDANQSLGDLARQERQRKKQSANSAQQEHDPADPSLKEATFKANILITDAHAAIEKWVLMPQAGRPTSGRIRQLVPGKKFYLPFVVTGYSWPATERMKLTARVRLISPDGKTQLDAPRISGALGPDPRSPSVIVLNPVMDITFDTNDPPGTYTLQVTVTDHIHFLFAKAEEQFQLIQPTGKASVKPASAPATVPR